MVCGTCKKGLTVGEKKIDKIPSTHKESKGFKAGINKLLETKGERRVKPGGSESFKSHGCKICQMKVR